MTNQILEELAGWEKIFQHTSLSQIDQDSLLRVLGQLGQSRIANNLNQLAKQANLGTLLVTPKPKRNC